MRPRAFPRPLLLALAALLLLAACSDSGGNAAEVTSAAPTTTRGPTTTTATSAGVDGTGGEQAPATGRILVSSSEITGHKGQTLLIFGPNNGSEICAHIDSDPWTLSEAALTDRAADSDPCAGTMRETIFEPGSHAVTASIFTPGSRTAAATTAALVELVDGDTQVRLDGGTLSATAAGNDGRIGVTVSDIAGQAGKILIVLGQNNAGSLCAVIDADPWTMPTPGTLRELPGDDGGPCGEGTPEVFFAAGDTRLTAAVFVPGSQSPETTLDMVVAVDGDITVTIDGSQLSN